MAGWLTFFFRVQTFECTQVFETATNNLNTKKFFVAGGVLFVICDDFALRLYNTRVRVSPSLRSLLFAFRSFEWSLISPVGRRER